MVSEKFLYIERIKYVYTALKGCPGVDDCQVELANSVVDSLLRLYIVCRSRLLGKEMVICKKRRTFAGEKLRS